MCMRTHVPVVGGQRGSLHTRAGDGQSGGACRSTWRLCITSNSHLRGHSDVNPHFGSRCSRQHVSRYIIISAVLLIASRLAVGTPVSLAEFIKSPHMSVGKDAVNCSPHPGEANQKCTPMRPKLRSSQCCQDAKGFSMHEQA